jgi:hypothetical protein
MQHDAWFFIGVFVFIFLIWIATGGPLHPLAFSGPSLQKPGILGGGTYLSLPRAPYGVGDTQVILPGSTGGGSVGSGGSIPTIGSGGSFGTPSPFRGLVHLRRGVQGAGTNDPKREYIEITIAQNAGVPINLSEWRLVSDVSGNSSGIPRGTEVPISGTINARENLVLSPGDRAIVSSGVSPIGASFRENKCIGYFSSFQTFYPALPQHCPTPQNELEDRYTDYARDVACVDYVRTLPRCRVTLSPPTSVSSSCQNFVVTYFNYNGCMTAHRSDADFKGKVWRVYLGRSTPMWRTRQEIVKLLDSNGKTVDAFSY